MPKVSLRQHVLQQRQQLDSSVRSRLAAAAQARLLGCDAYRSAGVVALYAPARGEVDTALLHDDALRSGKLVAYPRIVGERLEFVAVTGVSDLRPGPFGIAEPAGHRVVPLAAIELLLLPGVAFSCDGHRLGSGHGYYDRTLAGGPLSAVLAGLAYDFQLLATLPVEPHDVGLDLVVTDRRLVFCAPSVNR